MRTSDNEILKVNHCKVTCTNCGFEFLMHAGFEPDEHFKCTYCSGQDFKIFAVEIEPVHSAS